MKIDFEALFKFGSNLAERLGAKAFITFAVEAGLVFVLYRMMQMAKTTFDLVQLQWILIAGFGAMTLVAVVFMVARVKEGKQNGNNKPSDGGSQ